VNELISDVAEALVQEGLQAAFGVCGSGASLDLIGALAARDVPYFDAVHETSATLMAAEHGRQTGTFGLSVSIKGPGLANAVPGIVANAYENRVALSVAEAYADDGPRAHKRLDHASATFAAKAYATVADPGTVGRLLEVSRAETPGPVHLDLVSRDPARFEERPAPQAPRAPAVSVPAGVRRPVVIAGSLALRAGWGERLARLRVPVFTTFAAKGLVDEHSPFAAGVFTGEGKVASPESQLLADADLVVTFGLRPEEVLTPPVFASPSLSVEDVAGAEAAFAVLEACETDAGRVAAALATCRQALTGDDWRPGGLFARLQDATPAETCLALDVGAFCTAAEHVWLARAPLNVVASANGRFMGTALPTAIGALLADPVRPVVCVVGDGGLRPYVAELKLVVDLSLPLLLVLATDGRYGSVAGPAGTARDVPAATRIRRPSWLRAVEGLGCEAVAVSDLAMFADAVSAWDRATPRFVEASFDPATYMRGLELVR
jgi:acetolactate synthase-1/2/3 large subunit